MKLNALRRSLSRSLAIVSKSIIIFLSTWQQKFVCVWVCVCVGVVHLKILCKFCSILPCIINEQKFLVVSYILLELHINLCTHTHADRHQHTYTDVDNVVAGGLFAWQVVIIIMIIIVVILIMHCRATQRGASHYTYAMSDTLRGSLCACVCTCACFIFINDSFSLCASAVHV